MNDIRKTAHALSDETKVGFRGASQNRLARESKKPIDSCDSDGEKAEPAIATCWWSEALACIEYSVQAGETRLTSQQFAMT